MTIQCKNDFFSTKFTNEYETQTYLPTKDSNELVICVNMQGVQALFGGYINQLLIGWKRYPTVVTD